ncbi:phage tail protein [Geothrix campi]|uniref:phage tail protein n=1 Tax=Geothrix campi TaxID=2966450 RepID=UPI0021478F66|nr:phage tail protein [Geothrix sp. SG10]
MGGGGHSTSTVDQVLAGIQIQTSAYGGCLPVVCGTTRVPGNLLDYDDFTAIPHTTTQKVGKGGGGSTSSNTTYTYTAGGIMAICAGPITGVNQVWRDKEIGSLSGYGLTLFTGTRPQTAWSTWTTKHPTKAIGYSGMATVCSPSWDLGGSGAFKNHSFEVVGFVATEQDPAALVAYDAKPSAVVNLLLTDPYEGSGFPSAQLGDLVTGAGSYATYCQALGFVISPAFVEQKSTAEHLQDVLNATNSESVWTAGATGMLLKIVPYGDTAVTANGTTYTPNTTPLYDLTVDDFLVGAPDEDPIEVTISSPQDIFNCVPVEFLDRLNSYNVSVVDDPEPVDVALNGLKKDSPLTLHCITRSAVALQVSRIKAQRNVFIRRTYKFRLGWRYILLEPMVDLVTITEPLLGLDHKLVRIVSVEMPDENSEEEGLTIEAEEWPFGTGSATLYTTQTADGQAPNVNADPGAAAAPVIFDSPALYAEGEAPEITLATAGGPLWGGCSIWVSSTGSSYAQAGYISNPCRFGTLTANLAAWAGGTAQDNTNTLSVTLPNGGVLNTVDNATAAQGLNLIWVDGEMISFQTATLTGTNAYNLSGLYRGLYGTAPGAHLSGTKWAKLDTTVARYTIPATQIGQLLYIKLLSFNLWGAGGRQLASEAVYTWTPAAAAVPAPTAITVAVSDTRPT